MPVFPGCHSEVSINRSVRFPTSSSCLLLGSCYCFLSS
nr:MAG TPA: hypothetical protein [Caudoviricetes sp.]